MFNVKCESGHRIWMEDEVQIYKVARFERDAGRTMKGILHCYTMDQRTKGCGQYKPLDVENILYINTHPTLNKK